MDFHDLLSIISQNVKPHDTKPIGVLFMFATALLSQGQRLCWESSTVRPEEFESLGIQNRT